LTGSHSAPDPDYDTGSYSHRWYAVFLDTIPQDQTDREAAFVARKMPLPRYRRVMDLCCGSGRHARAMAALGYDVTGIDVNEAALAEAREEGGSVRYIQADMRHLDQIGNFDAAICLWQSFGHFHEAVNAEILRQITATVIPEGRVLLDVYNREFFESRTGVRTLMRGGEEVMEVSRLAGRRLTVELRYGDGAGDRFDWHLYTLGELESLGSDVGLRLRESCAAFDESQTPGEDRARMQLLFERCERGSA
jgi:SAM-dependent methyltransferase